MARSVRAGHSSIEPRPRSGAGALALIPPAVLPVGDPLWWPAAFFLLDNLLPFTLGALLPLGFAAGSAFLRMASRE
jgi:hypothetical protein